jgi:hypothetical protein
MTGKSRVHVIWAVLIVLLLGGAFVIVQRNGTGSSVSAPAAFGH